MQIVALSIALLLLSFTTVSTATAGKVDEAGALACVNDKWDEKEVAKDHKVVDYAGRCLAIPNDAGGAITSEDCTGKYEYMPDKSWKGSGTCVETRKDFGTRTVTFEEGSHLKEFTYKFTSGTGKWEGITGSGTYSNDPVTDTLTGGRYKATLTLP